MELDELLRHRVARDYTEEGFEEIFVRLDLLHDYAAAGRLDEITDMTPAQLRGWLRELVFTLCETLREIDGDQSVKVSTNGRRSRDLPGL